MSSLTSDLGCWSPRGQSIMRKADVGVMDMSPLLQNVALPRTSLVQALVHRLRAVPHRWRRQVADNSREGH
ncbi:hypothetical protein K443DRAFT_675360 [Laccaria amethystina LaAM-08-1]|uniref:Uncharacterized protein n=1 Tax=Laccaria amethystina LaAM-08-1 TaxID=1095629 RepID=A0A0C9Y4N0_9AGAR|nr:hypothetical protein K443DRAFT_675360 [Laccaria amethystina LaAM-08-1]